MLESNFIDKIIEAVIQSITLGFAVFGLVIFVCALSILIELKYKK